jgi:RNA polymerase sigma-70 factor (ECF subfamily)
MSLLEAMTPNDSSFDAQALLTQIAWVRRLARTLVPSDLHLAEDVTQEACLAALEHRPDSKKPLGGWLAEVARNLVRQNRRGEGRRSAREICAAKSEALPSTLDIVEQLSVHRELVDLVMGLDEPYRTTIVLRFFEELSPSAIAKREGLPVATVKTRLARGLERLRERLDREHGGDGRSWLLALIPICKPSSGTLAATTLGALLVSTSIKIGLAVAVVAGGVFFFWPKHAASTGAAAPRSALETTSAKPEPKYTQPKVELAREPQHDERAAVAPPPAKPASPALKAAPALAPWRGLVLDLHAKPVSGVRVCFHTGDLLMGGSEVALPHSAPAADATSVLSDGGGRFEIPAQDKAGGLVTCDEHMTTVLGAQCSAGAAQAERVVVVAPRLAFAGRAVDEAGQPVEGARVELRLPSNFRTTFAHNLDECSEPGWRATTRSDGRFELPDVPGVAGMDLVATHEGFVPSRRPAPELSDNGIEVALHRPTAAPGMISGEVVDERGRRVDAARVAVAQVTTITDENGMFSLKLPEGGAKTSIVALKKGYLPATERLDALLQAGDASAYIVLHLGPPPLSIEGRVSDAEDQPLSGMKVWVADPTFFGAVDEMPALVEGLLSGAATRSDIERMMRESKERSDPMEFIQGVPTVFWSFVKTDAEGRFKLEGLLDREYQVVAMDPATLLRVDSGPVHAGAKNVRIELPARLYFGRVAGRVVSHAGKPVAGVQVTPQCDVLTIHENENSRSTFHSRARSAVTDADGRFVLERLPREKVYLRLDGENILPIEFGRDGETHEGGIETASDRKVDDLVITASLRYHMQIELAPERVELADNFRVIDANGLTLEINVFEGSRRRTTDEAQIHDGKSNVVAVTDEAKMLVLSKGKLEVLRVPLALDPSGVNIVRP